MSAGEPARRAEDLPLPGGDFRLFVQRLAYQALIGLGLLENPLTRTKEAHPEQARSLIDDLAMLREKTRGNLTPDEDEHLARILRDLEHHLRSAERRAP
jgi:hypothetical protein